MTDVATPGPHQRLAHLRPARQRKFDHRSYNHSYFVPSTTHSLKMLIGSLANLDYRLRSSRPVHYPERSFSCYWGFYFVREREGALPAARRISK